LFCTSTCIGTYPISGGGGVIGVSIVTNIIDSTLSDNQALGGFSDGGGAFFGSGTVNIVNTTIAKNAASSSGIPNAGGDVLAFGGGAEFGSGVSKGNVTNVTIAYNKTVDVSGSNISEAGGIKSESSNIRFTNTLVALNTASTAPDFGGTVLDGGHNLIGNADGSTGFSSANGDLLGDTAHPLDPHLGHLHDNGGPTQTIALLPDSPAINRGDNNAVSVTGPNDQRGVGNARIFDGTIDIGAFELQPPPSGVPPAGTVVPVGPLMLFGFGFGPGGQLDLFEVDQKGQVFALAFSFSNFENPDPANAQFLNTDMVMQNMTVTNAGGFPALTGSLVGSDHQSMLMLTVPISLMPSAAFTDVLKAWQGAGG
jgi:hypothetical protein